ncbi:unnamed protein product [Protopolystoma xenopodis]|uniref:Uncharacterized protein n=1 Tax=Protopolystoma xenopodis TaxID=117903 RepID=A0A448WXB8_9PLAT|nr:unnamed protein product [Protopolystoma xenopodis]
MLLFFNAFSWLVLCSARLAYAAVAVDFVCLQVIWRQARNDVRKVFGQTSTSVSSTSSVSFLAFHPSSLSRLAVSERLPPLQAFVYLVCLLSRPTGALLWAVVALKECLLTQLWRDELAGQAPRARLKACFCAAVFYWVQGWTTFYQQVLKQERSLICVVTMFA